MVDQGCISAPTNLNSGDISRVIELCHTAEWEEAEKLHDQVKAVRLLFQDYAPIPTQKALLAERSGDSRRHNLHSPLSQISNARRDALANNFLSYGMSF